MPIVFDTDVWIAYQPTSLPRSLHMSVVVLQELIAGAADNTSIKQYETVRRLYEKEDKLIVPSAEDWFQAGRILNALLRGWKSARGGRTPKLHPAEKQRIIRDVLIARTVKRVNGLLITDNLKDFEQIKRFCNVRLISGKDYFS